MLSYDTPTCLRSKERATFFCCSEGCTLPSFGCSEECLSNHVDHQIERWDLIRDQTQALIDLPLEKIELQQLEQQDKQLLIVIEELKILQTTHWKMIRQSKQKLKLKEAALKVVEATKQLTTHQITGDEMANFIKMAK